MIDDELQALCRACGLCCDGSLFGCGSLEPDEVPAARRHRLAVLPRETAFEQPCTALSTEGCTIYAERPRACHGFVCRLYARHRSDGGALAERLAAVARVRELLRLADVEGEPPAAVIDELTQRMEEDFGRA